MSAAEEHCGCGHSRLAHVYNPRARDNYRACKACDCKKYAEGK